MVSLFPTRNDSDDDVDDDDENNRGRSSLVFSSTLMFWGLVFILIDTIGRNIDRFVVVFAIERIILKYFSDYS